MMLYKGQQYVQRGRGIGNLFSRFFRGVIPALSNFGRSIFSSPLTRDIGKTLLDSGVTGGLNVLSSALKGDDTKETLKREFQGAKRQVAGQLDKEVQRRRGGGEDEQQPEQSGGGLGGRGRKRKRKRVTTKRRKTAKKQKRSGRKCKKSGTIFDSDDGSGEDDDYSE